MGLLGLWGEVTRVAVLAGSLKSQGLWSPRSLESGVAGVVGSLG